MSSEQKRRIQVPDALREVLLEFSIAYLLEQPSDVINFAVDYFLKLQSSRRSPDAGDSHASNGAESEGEEEEPEGKFFIDTSLRFY